MIPFFYEYYPVLKCPLFVVLNWNDFDANLKLGKSLLINFEWRGSNICERSREAGKWNKFF